MPRAADEAPDPGRPTGIVDAIERLASSMAERRTWMDSKQAAEFLGVNHSEFKSMAARGEIPRHEARPGRYRYHAPELTEWLLSR